MSDENKQNIEKVEPLDPEKKSSAVIYRNPEDETCCYYNDKKYSNGSRICMEGQIYTCSYGNWVADLGESC